MSIVRQVINISVLLKRLRTIFSLSFASLIILFALMGFSRTEPVIAQVLERTLPATTTIKVITTDKFERDHLAKTSNEAINKAKDRNQQFPPRPGEFRVFHYLTKATAQGLEGEVNRWMSGGRLNPDGSFTPPGPTEGWLNYNTKGKFPIWEWCGKRPDKIEIREPNLRLGIASYDPDNNPINQEKARDYRVRNGRLDVYIHHFDGTIPPAVCP